MTTRKWGQKTDDEYEKAEPADLLNENQLIMKEQDAALDTLMDSVQRQKEIAKDIQKEVDEQAPLLDDIEAGLNKVEGRLKNTTQRVEQIRIKSSTKGMWCIICLLIIALVIVIILAKEL